MIYIGLINLRYPANVQIMFNNLLSFVNFDLYKTDDLNKIIFNYNNDTVISDNFELFDIF